MNLNSSRLMDLIEEYSKLVQDGNGTKWIISIGSVNDCEILLEIVKKPTEWGASDQYKCVED